MNGKQGFRVMTPKQARANDQIPAKVLASVDDFYECRNCGKVFWEGPKFASTRELFLSLVDAHDQDSSELPAPAGRGDQDA